MFREALEPMLDGEYATYVQSLPQGSPAQNPTAYRNSRLSCYWNNAPPDVVAAVEKEILERKKALAEKNGRDVEAPWRMDLSLDISEEDRLERAAAQQR